MSGSPGRSYRDAAALATGAQWMLYLDAGLAAAAAGLLLTGASENPAAALFWLVQIAVYAATAIVFLV